MYFPEYSMTSGAAKSLYHKGAYGRPATSGHAPTREGFTSGRDGASSLRVPNVTATPYGFHAAPGIDDSVLSYESAPLKTTMRESDIANQVRNFSNSSYQINLLHNNNSGSSLTPGMPSLTYEKLAASVALNPARMLTSRPTQRKLNGIDAFRPDITFGHGQGELPPIGISERNSAGKYHPIYGNVYQSREHIA